MRALDLPSGQRVILSDTVGFISDLPTQLIAAFRATLEEVNEADLILHIRDYAHEDADAQREDVIEVLEQLGIDADDGRPVIEVLNKIDLLTSDARLALTASTRLSRETAAMTIDEPLRIAVSATTGEGLEDLLRTIDDLLTRGRETLDATLAAGDGAPIAWLHAHGDVLEEESLGDMVRLRVRLGDKALGQFRKLYPGVALEFRPTAPSRLIA